MKHGLLLLSNADAEAVEEDIGHPIDVVPTTWNSIPADSPDDWVGPTWSGRSGNGTELEQKRQDMMNTFSGTGRQLVLAYPISDDHWSNYGPAIDGALDDAWRSFAQDLVDMGMEDTIFRPNHEHNLEWGRYPDSGDPMDFADAFARFVSVVTDVPGQNFDFVYSPGGHRLGIAKEAWPLLSSYWPSDQQSPIFTPSWYDKHWAYPDCAEIDAMSQEEFDQMVRDVWENHLRPEWQMWQDAADDLGARMGLVEWGAKSLYQDPPDNTECAPETPGDNPLFVRRTFQWARDHGWVVQAYWNGVAANQGQQQIWPLDEADVPLSAEAWFEEVRQDIRESGTSIEVGGYATPEKGTTDWHVPLNDNFTAIEEDVRTLADRLGANVTTGYARPSEGTTDWHVPLNDNFATIDSDVRALADELQSPPNVGGYATPEKGTTDWHVPLNDNFAAIENDLEALADMA